MDHTVDAFVFFIYLAMNESFRIAFRSIFIHGGGI